jgi:hypothetical protein
MTPERLTVLLACNHYVELFSPIGELGSWYDLKVSHGTGHVVTERFADQVLGGEADGQLRHDEIEARDYRMTEMERNRNTNQTDRRLK